MPQPSDNLMDRMLNGPIAPLLLRLAGPNVLAFLIHSLVSIAEIWYVGRLGTYSLAGLALVFPLLMLMQMISAGAMGGAVASSVARALGRGDLDRARALVWHSLVLGVLGAALFGAAYFGFGRRVLSALGGSGEVLTQAQAYADILFAGCVLIWTTNSLSSVYRGMGAMKYPAVLMVAGVMMQIPLSGALIFGWSPFPRLGIAGAAVSSVMTGLAMGVLLLLPLIFGRPVVQLRLQSFRLKIELFRDILKVGLLGSLSPVFSVLTILCITGLVGRFGPAALAGYGIGARLEFLLMPLIFGIGAAVTSMVGMNMGSGKYRRALRIGWTGAFTAGLMCGMIGVVVAVKPSWWVGLFADDPATLEAGAQYLRIVGSLFVFQGIGSALYFAFQGAGTVFWPVLSTLIRMIVSVGGAVAVVFGLQWGIEGIFTAAAAGILLFGCINMISWQRLWGKVRSEIFPKGAWHAG